MKLKVNEIFYSLQGEGAQTGKPVIFVRLSGCNLKCPFCDTKHEEGLEMTLDDILQKVKEQSNVCNYIIFTGGEPLLQLNEDILQFFVDSGYFIGLESNGTLPISHNMRNLIHHITISPKKVDKMLKVNFKDVYINEIRIPLKNEQKITGEQLQLLPYAERYYVSPVFRGNTLIKQNVDWCIQFCKDNPQWSLSIQLHKILGFA